MPSNNRPYMSPEDLPPEEKMGTAHVGLRVLVCVGLVVALAMLIGLVLLPGCGPKCKPKTARCNGSAVEICAPNKRWRPVTDCAKLKRTKLKWVCVRQSPTSCRCKPVKGAVR